MLARLSRELPGGAEYLYEPKLTAMHRTSSRTARWTSAAGTSGRSGATSRSSSRRCAASRAGAAPRLRRRRLTGRGVARSTTSASSWSTRQERASRSGRQRRRRDRRGHREVDGLLFERGTGALPGAAGFTKRDLVDSPLVAAGCSSTGGRTRPPLLHRALLDARRDRAARGGPAPLGRGRRGAEGSAEALRLGPAVVRLRLAREGPPRAPLSHLLAGCPHPDGAVAGAPTPERSGRL
jgi:hypothetical protein